MREPFARAARVLFEASPAMTLAALLIMPIVLPNRTRMEPLVEARRQKVARAMNDLPYALGGWIGTDIEVPPAAVRLLHPNAMLSRRYERLSDGAVVNVLMVHCSDARDMVGHFPPVCYPSSGWSPTGEREGVPVTLDAAGAAVPARMYEYTRVLEHGGEAGIRIFNVFVLPEGTLTREMDDIYAQSERLALSVQGAAQMQLITTRDMAPSESIECAAALVEFMGDMFRTFGVEVH
jgi:hypothetical protein